MADITTITETAQALFCAVADIIGLNALEEPKKPDKIDKMVKGKAVRVDRPGTGKKGEIWTYGDFEKYYKTLSRAGAVSGFKTIKSVFDSKLVRSKLGKGATFKEIENVMNYGKVGGTKPDNSWYLSSVYIARHLLKAIDDVGKKYPKVKIKGLPAPKIFYSRGDDEIMGTIGKLFTAANNGQKKLNEKSKTKGPVYGDPNKWSPADMYWSSADGQNFLKAELTEAKAMEVYSFGELNPLIMDLIGSGDLLPLSLKKAGKNVRLVKVNFNPECEKNSAALFHAGALKPPAWARWTPGGLVAVSGKKGETMTAPLPGKSSGPNRSRDIEIFITKRVLRGEVKTRRRDQTTKFIKIRHDASGGGLGALKVQLFEKKSAEPAGSLANPDQVADIMNKCGKKGENAGNQWLTHYNKAAANFVEYTIGRGGVKASTGGETLYGWDVVAGDGVGVKGGEKLDMRQLYHSKKNHKDYEIRYELLAGNVSGILITNGPIRKLYEWLKANPVAADKFVRMVYIYTTSRSSTSAQFVIAKS